MIRKIDVLRWYKNPLMPQWPKGFESTIKAMEESSGTSMPGMYIDGGEDYLKWTFDGNFGSTLAA